MQNSNHILWYVLHIISEIRKEIRKKAIKITDLPIIE